MRRTADYTIQGFIYQFIVTLHNLLNKTVDDPEIIVEGPIEDIDIITPTGIEAIQCKYHETKEKFTLSSIYKPVLQMMNHYHLHSSKNIKYRLYAHFPNETVGNKKKLTSTEVDQIVNSKAKEYKSLIDGLASFTDIAGFISKFELEFGSSLGDLEKAVIVALSNEGFSTEDAEDIFYPNAIHRIAEISTKHNEAERRINKVEFVSTLKEKKKTAICRWTKELNSFEKLLKKRREQMRDNLNKNSRERAIILDAKYIIDFDSKIVQFIEDFINKYNSKIKLHRCPLVSLICNETILNDIWRRLNAKKISVERGHIAGELNVDYFLRTPLKEITEKKIEFKVRLCDHDTEFLKVLSKANFDDIIIISDKKFDFIQIISDTNIDKLETTEINEIKYLLSLNNSI
jgi:hypothetical protein